MNDSNRISELFSKKKKPILSIFITAGFPYLSALPKILECLQNEGVDMVEIGVPFSDPMADGSVIQNSNNTAIQNGMNVSLLFEQLADIRKTVDIPLLLMGYLNPALQFGMENFLKKSHEVGIDGLILPDLPLWEYENIYKDQFLKYNLKNIFLITPLTSKERIQKIDDLSEGFIYAVSSHSITGSQLEVNTVQNAYFEQLRSLNLNNPTLIGFGINSKATFNRASQYANGCIVGSAFIKAIKDADKNSISETCRTFVKSILE